VGIVVLLLSLCVHPDFFSYFLSILHCHSAVSGIRKENSVWAQSAIRGCFRLNFMIEIGKKCFNELKRPKKGQNKLDILHFY
jgi:hypothetical protein